MEQTQTQVRNAPITLCACTCYPAASRWWLELNCCMHSLLGNIDQTG